MHVQRRLRAESMRLAKWLHPVLCFLDESQTLPNIAKTRVHMRKIEVHIFVARTYHDFTLHEIQCYLLSQLRRIQMSVLVSMDLHTLEVWLACVVNHFVCSVSLIDLSSATCH